MRRRRSAAVTFERALPRLLSIRAGGEEVGTLESVQSAFSHRVAWYEVRFHGESGLAANFYPRDYPRGRVQAYAAARKYARAAARGRLARIAPTPPPSTGAGA